jgi:hypothetical protein
MESLESLLGFKRIHKDRTEIKLLELVNSLKPGNELKVLGICASDFNNRLVQKAIQEKLMEGCTVKLLFLHSESKFVRQRADEERRDYIELRKELIAVNMAHKNFMSRLQPELRQKMKLGHYDAPASYLMFITDSKMIVGFYLREKQGEYTPHLELEIRENGVYESFLEHFNSLWSMRIELLSKRASNKAIHRSRRSEV